MDKDIQNEIKRLSNLRNTKDLPPETIEKMAIVSLKVREFEKNHEFLDKSEEKEAKSLYSKYLENYEFDSVSDLTTLGDLIVNEIQLKRIENSINDYYKKFKIIDDEKNAGKDKIITPIRIPDKFLKTKQDLENHILDLRLRLGIDKEDNEQDELTALQTLQKRFDKYILEHRNEFVTTCPSCGNLLLLRHRVKDFGTLKHPWFAGRWLFNYPLLKFVKEGILTKEQAWEILSSAGKGGKYKLQADKEYCTDYVNYCLENWKEITKFFNKE